MAGTHIKSKQSIIAYVALDETEDLMIGQPVVMAITGQINDASGTMQERAVTRPQPDATPGAERGKQAKQ